MGDFGSVKKRRALGVRNRKLNFDFLTNRKVAQNG
jgi:hypothetical protein